MKIIYNKWLPFKGYAAINLFGLVLARKEFEPLTSKTINHEGIHTAQMREMLYIFFYVWYGLEWLFRLVQYRNRKTAYYNISFEREAYANDRNLSYRKERKRYEWVKYM